jgi:methyltransferase (TIGR00027 family)
MSILSLFIYVPLQIAFIPFAVLGVMLVAYKQIAVSKKVGVSQTAVEIINARWTMHIFSMRDDDATAKLAAALPNTSLFGLWLVLFPLWVKSKISGSPFLYPRKPEPGSETLADFIVARTFYFDSIIEREIGGVEQFVMMGAGYDMRAYGNFLRDGVTFFEIDQPSVQQHKRAVLDGASISSEHVNFVSVDFTKENVFDKLIQSGYDLTKKTLFLWEGVTLYLSETEVRKAIKEIRSKAAVGSILLADIYADRMFKKLKSGAITKTLEYTNESIKFTLNLATNYDEALSEFIESESLSVGETFFIGWKDEKGPLLAIVEMKCD